MVLRLIDADPEIFSDYSRRRSISQAYQSRTETDREFCDQEEPTFRG